MSMENYECVPLKKRLNYLLANYTAPENAGDENNVVEQNGDIGSQSQSSSSVETRITATVSTEEMRKSESVECNKQEGLARADTYKVEHTDSHIKNPSIGKRSSFSQAVSQAVHLETEMHDELDNMVLKERLRMLITRKTWGQTEMPLQRNSSVSVPASVKLSSKTTVKRNVRTCSLQTNHFKHKSDKTLLLSSDITTIQHAPTPKLASIKVEQPNYNELVKSNKLAATPNSTSIKVEPLSYCQPQISNAIYEDETNGDFEVDELDHMLLRERMKTLSPKYEPSFISSKSSHCKNQIIESTLNCTPLEAKPAESAKTPLESKPAESVKVNRPRKRRRTATESIQTAMEEDAPGLLKVLIEKGVTVDEMKLYGEPECNDALEDLQSEDSFAELEEVIAKLFSQREPLLKFAPLRGSKGEKTSYCLECLFSLVEQARYLRFRNWPVEWGWCRDLQSFIFVFERHNRIVLERPEYGFATYFFELVQSVPINWQIKRLVTAMKLASCSRITLLENRTLKVGDDLSEGEAKVLTAFGWTPGTGLGTMLNYYDRVVHDKKNERNVSEWRSKIGKCLMDGYNSGSLVCTNIPSKVMGADPVQVKLEVD